MIEILPEAEAELLEAADGTTSSVRVLVRSSSMRSNTPWVASCSKVHVVFLVFRKIGACDVCW